MTAIDSIASIEAEWQQLVESTGAAPFQDPGWVASWLASFGEDGLRVYTVRRAGALVGVLPTRRRRGTVLSLANWHTPFCAPLALDGEAAAALAQGLHDDRPRRIELRCLHPDLPETRAFVSALHGLGYRPLPASHVRLSPYADLPGDWETFASRLGRRRRSEIRRLETRLAECGDPRFEVCTGGDDLDGKLAEAFRIESSGWKGRSGSAIASATETQEFYTHLARWAADQGTLRLHFLRADGRAIAFGFNLEHGDTIYGLRIGYDEEYRRYGPGVLVVKAVMTRGMESGARRVDMGGDLETDPYKRAWADGSRRVLTGRWLAPTLCGWAEHRVQMAARNAAQTLDVMLPAEATRRLRAARTGMADRLGHRRTTTDG